MSEKNRDGLNNSPSHFVQTGINKTSHPKIVDSMHSL